MATDLNDVDACLRSRLRSARTQCEQHGARFTPMRARMLELLLQHNRFVTAYELLDSMLETHPRTNAASIYRILNFLMQAGLVYRLATVNGYVTCNSVTGRDYRIFAICSGCGKVSELDGDGVQEILAARVARAGCALAERAAEIKVVCRDCQQDGSAYHLADG